MNKDDELKKDKESLEDIIKMIDTHRNNAYRKVNEELVSLYYEIGKYLSINSSIIKLDEINKIITLDNKMRLKIGDIISINSEIFEELY